MPASLMTAYFSVEIKDLKGSYNAKTYWASFGVVVSLSLLFVFGFEKISASLAGTTKAGIKRFYHILLSQSTQSKHISHKD
jgi:hypothetical protein